MRKNNFESSDKKLNVVYTTLASKIFGQSRQSLVHAQREWILYKESACLPAYDSITPGEEAGIEKWTCLDELTKIRTIELQYIESVSGMEDFYHAVDVASQFYESGDRN